MPRVMGGAGSSSGLICGVGSTSCYLGVYSDLMYLLLSLLSLLLRAMQQRHEYVSRINEPGVVILHCEGRKRARPPTFPRR